MFLLRVGLFTLMNMESMIILAKLCHSLLTLLKLYNVVGWSVVDWWPYVGYDALRCSLNLSPNVLADSPMYSSL